MYTPDQLAGSLAQVREAAEQAGRDPSVVRGAVFCWGGVHTDADRARREVVAGVSAVYQQDFAPLADRYLLHGDPDRVLARVREYADAGADTLVFSPVGSGSRRRELVQLFTADVVGPAARSPMTRTVQHQRRRSAPSSRKPG